MSNLIKIVEKQIVRQQILEILSEAGAEGLNEKIIHLAIKKAGYEISCTLLKDALYYLTEKGLIAVRNLRNKRASIDMDIYRITAKGIDVIEGTEEASGIGEDSYV